MTDHPPSATAAGPPTGAESSLWGDAVRELVRNPLFVVPLLVLVVFLVMAAFPQLFADAAALRQCDLANARDRPRSGHPFGFDVQGCDYYTRVIFGARASITIGFLATAIAAAIAVVFGLLAGFYRGAVDALVSRVTDVVFALPLVLGAIVILSVVPNRGILEVAVVIGLFGWPSMLRLMRSTTLSVRETDYVQAARALGARNGRIIRRHVLPNAIAPVIAYGTVFIGIVIVVEAVLSFLGIGLQLPAISWGLMLSGVSPALIRNNPHLLLFPGLFLSLTVFSIMLIGDALRDALDPKLR